MVTILSKIYSDLFEDDVKTENKLPKKKSITKSNVWSFDLSQSIVNISANPLKWTDKHKKVFSRNY